MADSNPILPFKNFRFVISFSTNPLVAVAAVSKVSALKRTTEVVTHRDGGDLSTPRHAPGSTKFEPITLERGVTLDTSFEEWANRVYSTDSLGTVSLDGYKRDLTIEVRNVSGVAVLKYTVTRAWVSEFVALPDLDANANAVMLEHVVIQNEGWHREELPTPGKTDD